MRILVFSEPTFPEHPGGAGKCAHLYAAALVRRGHSVRIVCPGALLKRETMEGIEVHRVPLEGKPPRPGTRVEENGTAAGLLRYVLASIPMSGVDLMLDIGGFLSYFYTVEYELRRRYRIPLVAFFQLLQDHAARTPAFWHTHKERPQCFLARIADTVVCLSEEEAAFVRRLFHPRELHILGNPFDPALPLAEPDAALARQLAACSGPRLLFAGRFDDPVKGRDIVRRAFQIALRRNPNLRLLLMGNTSDGYFRRLGSRAIHLGWMRDPASVAAVFRASDLLLMPSRYEPFGMLCAEAMAMGVPAIATPVGGLKEIVCHGDDGVLLAGPPSQWPREMADWILRLTAPGSELPRLAANAKRSAQRFSADPLAARLESICAAALAGHTAAPPRTVEPPRLDAAAQRQYLELFPAAADAAKLALPRFLERSETRCLACSRRGMARAASQVRAKPGARAVLTACPLGLLQVNDLERMGSASPLRSFCRRKFAQAVSGLRRLLS